MQEKYLTECAKAGDKAALGQIIDMYYNDVCKFLVRRHGDEFTAQDITQNTFLKFSQSLSMYRDKGKLRSYIFTIAVSCSNDYFRVQHKNDISIDECENAESTHNVYEDCENTDRRERVKSAVMSLPEVQRDVVLLRYYHDMKQTEIAKILCIPLSTVKTRLFRANKSLREKLKGEF